MKPYIAIVSICLLFAGLHTLAETAAYQQQETLEDEWHDHCRVYPVTHEGRRYAVRQSRDRFRQVCLIDQQLNPGGCDHLTCGGETK